jgi:hypothetical protein
MPDGHRPKENDMKLRFALAATIAALAFALPAWADQCPVEQETPNPYETVDRFACGAMIAAQPVALPGWADQAPPQEGSPFLVTDRSGRGQMP